MILLLAQKIRTWKGRLVFREQSWILLANVVLWSRPVGQMRRLLRMMCRVTIIVVVIRIATGVERGPMVHLTGVVLILVHHVRVLRMVHVIVSTPSVHVLVRVYRPDGH